MGMIEPCCCHKQLPKLLRENQDRICVFQTSGDVTMQKFNFAVSFMAGDTSDRILVLPTADVWLLREVRHDIAKGWAKSYTLIIGKDCAMTDAEIAAEVGSSHVRVLRDQMARTPLFSLSGSEGTVIIVGDMKGVADAGLKYYTAFFGTNKECIEQSLSPIRSRIKLKVK